MNRRAILLALLSAFFFGLSTPAAKVLVGATHPAVLAGILYCGAGFGLAILRRAVLPLVVRSPIIETPIGRSDLPWLAGAIVAGGVAGPLLLMWGLTGTPAATASLLLTLEAPATALLAWFVFHENFDRRVAAGMACLVCGAILLAWSGQPTLFGLLGPAAIVGACLAWGLDNNLTRKISLADPLQIVELKGVIAGPINVALGLWAGGRLAASGSLWLGAMTGFVGYGVSLVLFVFALRELGAARTGAYFSTAPFVGALAAIALLGEPLTPQFAIAGLLMALGVWLHLTERHEHEHLHELKSHSHAHVHDEHHQHAHEATDPPGEPHAHAHTHERTRHSHPHVPDMHHTHKH